MKETKIPIETNLIQQNCFIKIANKSSDEMKPFCHTQYFELQRKTVSNGIVEDLVAVDYPINPESVKSYADSSDYRNDPNGALAKSVKKTNLGDVTQAQEAIKLDTQQAKDIYNKVLSEVKAEIAKQSAVKSTEEVEPNA